MRFSLALIVALISLVQGIVLEFNSDVPLVVPLTGSFFTFPSDSFPEGRPAIYCLPSNTYPGTITDLFELYSCPPKSSVVFYLSEGTLQAVTSKSVNITNYNPLTVTAGNTYTATEGAQLFAYNPTFYIAPTAIAYRQAINVSETLYVDSSRPSTIYFVVPVNNVFQISSKGTPVLKNGESTVITDSNAVVCGETTTTYQFSPAAADVETYSDRVCGIFYSKVGTTVTFTIPSFVILNTTVHSFNCTDVVDGENFWYQVPTNADGYPYQVVGGSEVSVVETPYYQLVPCGGYDTYEAYLFPRVQQDFDASNLGAVTSQFSYKINANSSALIKITTKEMKDFSMKVATSINNRSIFSSFITTFWGQGNGLNANNTFDVLLRPEDPGYLWLDNRHPAEVTFNVNLTSNYKTFGKQLDRILFNTTDQLGPLVAWDNSIPCLTSSTDPTTVILMISALFRADNGKFSTYLNQTTGKYTLCRGDDFLYYIGFSGKNVPAGTYITTAADAGRSGSFGTTYSFPEKTETHFTFPSPSGNFSFVILETTGQIWVASKLFSNSDESYPRLYSFEPKVVRNVLFGLPPTSFVYVLAEAGSSMKISISSLPQPSCDTTAPCVNSQCSNGFCGACSEGFKGYGCSEPLFSTTAVTGEGSETNRPTSNTGSPRTLNSSTMISFSVVVISLTLFILV